MIVPAYQRVESNDIQIWNMVSSEGGGKKDMLAVRYGENDGVEEVWSTSPWLPWQSYSSSGDFKRVPKFRQK